MPDELQLIEDNTPFASTLYPVDAATGTGGVGMDFSLGSVLLIPTPGGVPAYWSSARDSYLREFVLQSDPLKVAVNTFINKLVSVPVSIIPRDSTIERHAAVARQLLWNLENLSGWMRGFREELKKIARDYLETDNGAFALILGKGAANKPVLGPAMGILHLDSGRCQRTGDPEFPFIYLHTDNKRYAIHYSRGIAMSNMPSPIQALYGVGLCAVSCALESARELKDISTFSAEKMGSRPPRQILYARTGATISELSSAVQVFEQKQNAEGLERFSKTLLIAPKSANMNLALDKIDLASTPDGFDRERVSVLDLSLLSAAFGLDLHDLSLAFGVSGGGGTKGNAEVQAKKGRGKGVHEFIETFTDQFQRRFLPEYLTFQFDEMDDDADQQHADIGLLRAQSREKNLNAGVTTLRVERVTMLKEGDLSPEDFAMVELADGRTPDGLDILFLFHSEDPVLQKYLGDFSVPDPTDITTHDAATIVPEIRERQIEVYRAVEAAPNALQAGKARMALYALQKLETLYMEAPPPDMGLNAAVSVEAMDAGAQADNLEDTEDADPTQDVPPPAEEATAEQKEASLIEKQDAPFPIGSSSLSNEDNALIRDAFSSYTEDFEDLVRQAKAGEIEEDGFVRAITDLTTALLLLLFLRGSNLTVRGLTDAQRQVIADQISVAQASAQDFGTDLYQQVANPILPPLSLAQALARAGLWTNMAVMAYSLGQLQRTDNPRLRWRYGPTDHCADCLRLNGQVHTAAGWRASGWVPRAPHLACHGFNCQCRFEETTDAERGAY